MTSSPLRARELPDALPAIPGAVSRPPFVHFGPGPLADALAGVPEAEVTEFLGSWDDLPGDAHLGTEKPYRFRRYGKFRLRSRGLAPLPHAPFFQDASVNRVNGGVARLFAPLHPSVAAGEPLRRVVLALLDRLPGPRAGIDTCGVHQIRVVATVNAEGHPAPEGVHRDGHCYVAQVLIRRQDVRGAESCLYDPERRPVHRAVLTAPLETIILDDRRVLHGVSPVRPASGAATGVRDMLLVDFLGGS